VSEILSYDCRRFRHTAAEVHSVTVAAHTAHFAYHDPIQNVNPTDPSDPHRYPEVHRKLYGALAESDEGELSIALPPQVQVMEVEGAP
jgi:transcription initiation factor TFIID subunit 2